MPFSLSSKAGLVMMNSCMDGVKFSLVSFLNQYLRKKKTTYTFL